MSVFIPENTKWTWKFITYLYRIGQLRSTWEYSKALKTARKRAALNPDQNIFCVSARHGKEIWHFYRRKARMMMPAPMPGNDDSGDGAGSMEE